jgi:hypothetical protein
MAPTKTTPQEARISQNLRKMVNPAVHRHLFDFNYLHWKQATRRATKYQ